MGSGSLLGSHLLWEDPGTVMRGRRSLPPVLVLLVFVTSACTPPEEERAPIAFPPTNPYLADSAWPISHSSPYSQGSSPLPGPAQDGDYSVEFVEVGLTSVTLVPAPLYPDGQRVVWGSTPTEVYRLRLSDPPEIVDQVPSGGGLSDLMGGAYTLLDADGTFFTVASTTVTAYGDADPEDSGSAIELRGEWEMSDAGEDENLRGLGITWDGALVVVSSTGRVIALSRGLSVRAELQLEGEVSNSIAVDEDGGIYVVTSEALFRVQWTGDGLSDDPADGAWRAEYESGDGQPVPGRLGLGSGSTPSLMTVGEDELVVITDAQELMHLVLFWRDQIPVGWSAPPGNDPRVAGIQPVTFGVPSAQSSVSEQSVLVMGDGAVVVNNDYGELSGIEPVIQGLAPPGIERFSWDAEEDVLTSAWAIPDLSCPNGIPSASAATGLMYCVGKRDETWTIEAIDWAGGASAFSIPMGTENLHYNSSYAATEIGPDESILTGTLTGMVWVRP